MSARLADTPAEPEPGSTPSRQQILPRPSGGIILSSPERYAVFGPREHMEALHPEALNGKRAGTVSFATRTAEGWKEWSVKASEAPQIAQDLIDHGEHVDLYFSHQRFRGWRDTERLLGLASLYCDVDFHSVDAWRGKDPRAVLVAILEALREARIPPPSYALDSGRGLLRIWSESAMMVGLEFSSAPWSVLIVRSQKTRSISSNASERCRPIRSNFLT